MEILEIGGAIVRRRLSGGIDGKTPLLPGVILTADQVTAMTSSMRRALVEQRTIDIFYHRPASSDASVATGTCHLIPVGKGQYHVVRGHVISGSPLSRAQAEALISKTNAVSAAPSEPVPEPDPADVDDL